MKHQCLGGVPGIHQYRVTRQLLLVHDVAQHLTHMIEFAFAVSLWIIEAVVNQLELIQRRIDVHAGHDPNTLDELFGIAAVLASHQFDRKGSVLIQHRVVEDDVALSRRHDLAAHVVPYQPRRDPFTSQVAVDGIMAE